MASRSLDFYVFRDGSCFSTLICEDLARMDPCQPILRSIGPNIVFALLMDGPQLKDRWPGRYAMSLADDPGSSVLSLTSKALMRRSSHMFNTPETIALWRDPYGETIELVTPVNSHALLLNLARSTNEDNTLDGRREKKKSYSWRICGSQPLEDVSYGQ